MVYLIKSLFGRVILLLVLLTSCAKEEAVSPTTFVSIAGRNLQPIYRVRVPQDWSVVQDDKDLSDTTKPLCTLVILGEAEEVRITIHNFPVAAFDQKVPPAAQVMRWQRQLGSLDPTSIHLVPQARAGFIGLRFEGRGELKGQEAMMIGWSLQIGQEHFRKMAGLLEKEMFLQMGADVTIKAVGPVAMMEANRLRIIACGESLELIEEIPR